MRMGILETDHLSQDLLQSFGSYGEQFTKLLQRVNPKLDVECFDVIEQQYPEYIDRCDAYLITGSKNSAYDNLPWIHRLQDYIQKLDRNKKPLIGICFGHQLIAHTLGGQTLKSDKGWGLGANEVEVLKHQDWMTDHQPQFTLLASHQDQVVSIPDSAEVIAGSAFCTYAALQIGQHILSFQGHPEFSKTYLLALMDKRRSTIGESTFNNAVKSLGLNTDSNLIAKWILDFLSGCIKQNKKHL